MPDPNWFYSTLAQCAAAIVGLLGAVLFGRLLDQRGKVTSEWASLRPKILAFQDDRQRLIDGFDEQERNTESGEVERRFYRSAFLTLAALPPYFDELPETYGRSREALEEARRALDVAESPHDATMGDIYKMTDRYEWLSSELHNFKKTRTPPFTSALLCVLTVFSLVSIALPLSRLTAHEPLDKVILLALFCSGLAAVQGFLWQIVWDLKRIGSTESIRRTAPELIASWRGLNP
jgi:hypothetical protein